jgi:hypothetical protein
MLVQIMDHIIQLANGVEKFHAFFS